MGPASPLHAGRAMEPLPGIVAFAALFDRARGARLDAAERFVSSLPRLFPEALVGCDLAFQPRAWHASRLAKKEARCRDDTSARAVERTPARASQKSSRPLPSAPNRRAEKRITTAKTQARG